MKPLGSVRCVVLDGLCVVVLLTLHSIRLWQHAVNTFFEKVIDLYALETREALRCKGLEGFEKVS